MIRDSTRIGAFDVEYELSFEASSLIQRNSYAILSIPNNDIKVRDRSISCWEKGSKRNFDCNVQEETNSHFVIKIDGLCKYDFCQAGDEISIVLDLANSNSIVFDEAKKAIELAIFTNEGYPVQKLPQD